ncbi:MAG: hypothetical protein K2Z81_12125, partial [Cyanobacteria bacterium]|nr:hypothetical protein [Cyanobacteriota bacterium]
LARAHQIIIDTLTTNANGRPLTASGEIKLNNPTLSGIGVVRRGQPVTFEGLGTAELPVETLLGQMSRPSWLRTAGEGGDPGVVVPREVWRDAQRRNIPIVVIDGAPQPQN